MIFNVCKSDDTNYVDKLVFRCLGRMLLMMRMKIMRMRVRIRIRIRLSIRFSIRMRIRIVQGLGF